MKIGIIGAMHEEIVELKSGGYHRVLEEPQEIMKMIDNALHESNKK